MKSIVLSFLVLVLTSSTLAGEHYIRAGASGRSNGDDWINAWSDLPETFVRGDVYYVAAGVYSGHMFDTPEQRDSRITVRKATAFDHGTGSGWKNEYADGQATFGYNLIFKTGYWTWDGVTGGGIHDSSPTSRGFAVRPPGDCTNMTSQISIMLGNNTGQRTDHVIISHTSLVGCGQSYNQEELAIHQGWSYSSGDYLTISYNYFSGWQNSISLARSNHSIIEQNYLVSNWSSPSHHGEQINIGDVVHNLTIRYNFIASCTGTACIASNSLADSRIYGNIFVDSVAGNGIIAASASNYTTNTHIYNNTVINNKVGSFFYQANPGIVGAAGNVVRNNLLSNSKAAIGGAGQPIVHTDNAFFSCTSVPTDEPGSQVSTGDPFLNRASGDYRLKTDTRPGIALPSPFGEDADGVLRSLSSWTRGAFQFRPPTANRY